MRTELTREAGVEVRSIGDAQNLCIVRDDVVDNCHIDRFAEDFLQSHPARGEGTAVRRHAEAKGDGGEEDQEKAHDWKGTGQTANMVTNVENVPQLPSETCGLSRTMQWTFCVISRLLRGRANQGEARAVLPSLA